MLHRVGCLLLVSAAVLSLVSLGDPEPGSKRPKAAAASGAPTVP